MIARILYFVACRLAGSYEALTGGQTGDALVDFTGGVNETVDIREGGYQSDEAKQQELFAKMEHGHNHKSLISCSIHVRSVSQVWRLFSRAIRSMPFIVVGFTYHSPVCPLWRKIILLALGHSSLLIPQRCL